MPESVEAALTRQLREANSLIQSLETDRDQWKDLAQLADKKLVELRNSMCEALEASE